MFRAAYATAVEFCGDKHLDPHDPKVWESAIPEFLSYSLSTPPSVLQSRFHSPLGKHGLKTASITQNSPVEIVFFGLVTALTLAVILSGGKCKVGALGLAAEFEIGPLGEGIAKLKRALGVTKPVEVGYGLQHIRIKLNRTELAELFKQDPAQKHRGGFQSFLVSIQNNTNKNTGMLELTEKQLDRIMKYKSDHKKGGYQSRFKKIFGRHFP